MLLYLTFTETPEEARKFEEIYRRYRSKMISSANAVLHNIPDSEDAVHEALISIAKNMKSIGDVDSLQTMAYVCRAARNRAINIKNKSQREAEMIEKEKLNIDIKANDAFFNDDIEAITKCIRELPDTYRDTLYLYYVEDMSALQISKQLGLKNATVKKQIIRGKKILISLLKRYGVIYEQ